MLLYHVEVGAFFLACLPSVIQERIKSSCQGHCLSGIHFPDPRSEQKPISILQNSPDLSYSVTVAQETKTETSRESLRMRNAQISLLEKFYLFTDHNKIDACYQFVWYSLKYASLSLLTFQMCLSHCSVPWLKLMFSCDVKAPLLSPLHALFINALPTLYWNTILKISWVM